MVFEGAPLDSRATPMILCKLSAAVRFVHRCCTGTRQNGGGDRKGYLSETWRG